MRMGKAMSDVTTLSAKFQISIPKSVREANDWKAGQRFAFIPKGSGVLLVPVPNWDDLQGIAKGVSTEDYRDRDDRY
jgi:AbrB family looped-hinge helix DNA binding protein